MSGLRAFFVLSDEDEPIRAYYAHEVDDALERLRLTIESLNAKIGRLERDCDVLTKSAALAIGIDRPSWRRLDGSEQRTEELGVSMRVSLDALFSFRGERRYLYERLADQIGRNVAHHIVQKIEGETAVAK